MRGSTAHLVDGATESLEHRDVLPHVTLESEDPDMQPAGGLRPPESAGAHQPRSASFVPRVEISAPGIA
ncbi:MAG: hypothetical protein ACYCTE_16565, partial [Acidimicrobiales bacterium]